MEISGSVVSRGLPNKYQGRPSHEIYRGKRKGYRVDGYMIHGWYIYIEREMKARGGRWGISDSIGPITLLSVGEKGQAVALSVSLSLFLSTFLFFFFSSHFPPIPHFT